MKKIHIILLAVVCAGAFIGAMAQNWNPYSIAAKQGVQIIAEKNRQEKTQSQAIKKAEEKSLKNNGEPVASSSEEIVIRGGTAQAVRAAEECAERVQGIYDISQGTVTASVSPDMIDCY